MGQSGSIVPMRPRAPPLDYDACSMIRKLKTGEYRLYSRKKNPRTGKRRNLGTFPSLDKAKAHERAVQYFKRHKRSFLKSVTKP